MSQPQDLGSNHPPDPWLYIYAIHIIRLTEQELKTKKDRDNIMKKKNK